MGPDGAGPAFHRIAEELAKRSRDPDYTSAFYAGMDPDLVKNLPMAIAVANAPTAMRGSLSLSGSLCAFYEFITA